MTVPTRPDGPAITGTARDSDHPWVPALGFGAHLRHLLTVTGLPWRVLALAAGVSPLTVDRLLGNGRPLRRIRAGDARRLLLLDPRDLAVLELQSVAAGSTASRVRALLEAGLPAGLISGELGVGHDELVALATGRTRRCSAMVRLRTRAACQQHRLWTHLDDASGDPEEAC